MSDKNPNDQSSDPNAVMSGAGPAKRTPPPPQTPILGDALDNDAPPLNPLVPDRMHRAERDPEVRATSPDFSDHPAGSQVPPEKSSQVKRG